MNTLFFPKNKTETFSKEKCKAYILAQRFEGKSSIDGISTLMKRSEMPYSSVGSISECLCQIGQSLPCTLKNECESESFIVFASDEVYAKSIPLLITVDPISSVILRIERANQRTAEIWSNHFQSIQGNGFRARLFTSDAGTGLCAAHKDVFGDIPWQLDTFHGIAHCLGDWVRRLEKSAYSALQLSEEREEKLDSAKSKRVIDKRLTLCLVADSLSEQAIELYDNFHYLYKVLIHELTLFNSKGELRQRAQAEGNMEAALELMASLNHKAINKTLTSVKKALPDLLTYFDEAPAVIKRCQKLSTKKDALHALYLAWQWNKAIIKAKEPIRKNKAREQQRFYLELAELFIEEKKKYTELKDCVYAELDTIIQASSMVECINSILRPYLNNSKNQVTQEFLNTFMFYHNHRRYHAGKRKGKTPMEILTGKKQKEDWIILLMREINQSVLAA